MVFGLGPGSIEPRKPPEPAGEQPLKILICCDGSEHSMKAVELAAALVPTSARVRLVTVASQSLARYEGPWGPLSDESQRSERLNDVVGAAFDEPLKRLEEAGIKAETIWLLGNPVDEILDQVKQWEPEVVVVGRYGTSGLKKMVMGSVSDSLVKHAQVPVLVVP